VNTGLNCSKERFYLPTIAKAPKRVMTQQVRPAYRKPQ
jgi:hypothetical protein